MDPAQPTPALTCGDLRMAGGAAATACGL